MQHHTQLLIRARENATQHTPGAEGLFPDLHVGTCSVFKTALQGSTRGNYRAAGNVVSLQLVAKATWCSRLSQTAQVRMRGSRAAAKPSSQPSTSLNTAGLCRQRPQHPPPSADWTVPRPSTHCSSRKCGAMVKWMLNAAAMVSSPSQGELPPHSHGAQTKRHRAMGGDRLQTLLSTPNGASPGVHLPGPESMEPSAPSPKQLPAGLVLRVQTLHSISPQLLGQVHYTLKKN